MEQVDVLTVEVMKSDSLASVFRQKTSHRITALAKQTNALLHPPLATHTGRPWGARGIGEPPQ